MGWHCPVGPVQQWCARRGASTAAQHDVPCDAKPRWECTGSGCVSCLFPGIRHWPGLPRPCPARAGASPPHMSAQLRAPQGRSRLGLSVPNINPPHHPQLGTKPILPTIFKKKMLPTGHLTALPALPFSAQPQLPPLALSVSPIQRLSLSGGLHRACVDAWCKMSTGGNCTLRHAPTPTPCKSPQVFVHSFCELHFRNSSVVCVCCCGPLDCCGTQAAFHESCYLALFI